MNDLRVRLYVYEPSDVELDASEKVQMHRLACSDNDGFTAARHGGLLRPGTSRMRLDTGVYQFRTLDDAALRVAVGGNVSVISNATAVAVKSGKDPWPTPPPPPPPPFVGAAAGPWDQHGEAFAISGDGPRGRVPTLTVIHERSSEP